ncbi:MAG: HlyD family type I secretion periplasmic adaptor subunit [Gammaproteobacteria bacterium]|nr:HlyD family type I secretion periplasmic adaptor subunit [Gammaproteobacteria bacterium]
MSVAPSPYSAPASLLEFNQSDYAVARKQILIGYLIIGIFFGAMFLWSALAPISSAAVATGVVGKDGHRKTVQHLEGGIIQEILVRDGDAVSAGQQLMVLQDVQKRSDYELLYKQKLIALAKQASLVAESQEQPVAKDFLPKGVSLDSIDESVRQSINGYITASTNRQQLLRSQLELIDQRQQQAQGKINALQDEKRALAKQKKIIAAEHKQYREFESKGLVTRAQVFALQRDKAEIDADWSANQVAIESTRQEINNLSMEKSELLGSHSKRITTELDKVRAQLVDLDEQLAITRDKLDRTVIRAPIAGIVVDLRVNTLGGVIKPGDALLDIVPSGGELIIEAKVKVKDRDTIRVGQNAEVRFTAFNQRMTTSVAGTVKLISADSLINNSSTGAEPYYKATIALLEDPSTVLNGAAIYPGMQADVMIITGERTALQYFFMPITRSFQRAFRDD